MFKYLIETIFMTKATLDDQECVTPKEQPEDNYLVEVFSCEPVSTHKEWKRNSQNRLESIDVKSD